MSVKPRKELKDLTACIHGGFNYAELQKLNINPNDVLDFSVNSNPFPLSPQIKDVLAQSPITTYPDSDSYKLKVELAKANGITEENLLVGSGAMELIRLVAQAYIATGDTVVIPQPTFGEYETSCHISGAQIVTVTSRESDNYKIDTDRLIEEAKKVKAKIVFLCNPNNPTGQYLAKTRVETLLNALEDSLVVLDEAYIAFTDGAWSSMGMIDKTNLVIVRSMTKDYALAGLRLGYVAANSKVIATLKKVCPPWNVNAAAQQVGLYMLKDSEYIKRSEAAIKRAKEYLAKSITGLGYHVLSSRTNFFLVKVRDATAFRNTLLSKGILVRDCSSFGMPQYVRIAARTMEECRLLVDTMKRL